MMKKTNINPDKTRKPNGFTLIELLIAVAIFATVAIMAGSGLRSVLGARDITEENAKRLSELQRGMLIIQNDIEQIINRKVRDEYGDSVSAIKGSASDGFITFTRAGVLNPLKLRRSSLQRVTYQLEETDLVRMAWHYIDGALEDDAQITIVMTEVDSLEFGFLSGKDKWEEQWPTMGSSSASGNPVLTPEAVPKAIKFNLNLIDHGEISRLFIVPGGDAQW